MVCPSALVHAQPFGVLVGFDRALGVTLVLGFGIALGVGAIPGFSVMVGLLIAHG